MRKSELSQDMISNKSIISIKGDREVTYKYGASEKVAAEIAAQFSMTVPPQNKPILDQDALNMSVKESLMNT